MVFGTPVSVFLLQHGFRVFEILPVPFPLSVSYRFLARSIRPLAKGEAAIITLVRPASLMFPFFEVSICHCPSAVSSH